MASKLKKMLQLSDREELTEETRESAPEMEIKIPNADSDDSEIEISETEPHDKAERESDKAPKRKSQKEKSQKNPRKKRGGAVPISFVLKLLGVFALALVVVIGIAFLRTSSLKAENKSLKTENAKLKAENKKNAKSLEDALAQLKKSGVVVVDTDEMFQNVTVAGKEYKFLGAVSDFTKAGYKLTALREETATLVPGGKLEKDAFLTDKNGNKIGIIIRNLSDENQKVSDCTITKLVFAKENFSEKVALAEGIDMDSTTEKVLTEKGFEKAKDGSYQYVSSVYEDDAIKITFDSDGNIAEITMERQVSEADAEATTQAQ